MNRAWRETENHTELYFQEEDGLIVGQVHRLGNQTIIWMARIYHPITYQDAMLGHYITRDFARRAVEHWWDIQDRTLLE